MGVRLAALASSMLLRIHLWVLSVPILRTRQSGSTRRPDVCSGTTKCVLLLVVGQQQFFSSLLSVRCSASLLGSVSSHFMLMLVQSVCGSQLRTLYSSVTVVGTSCSSTSTTMVNLQLLSCLQCSQLVYGSLTG